MATTNQKLRKEIKDLTSEEYTELRDCYYKIGDGLAGLDFLKLNAKPDSELQKQLDLLKQVGKLFDQSQLGSVL